MPKVVKYSTTTPSGSLRKGNMAIGPGNYDYGTSFYSTIEPPSGGYTIYLNKASNGPSIYCPANDTQLINITKEISGTTYANAAACLNYFATQTDKIIIASSDNIPVSVTSGSVLNLNAGMVGSYPTTGTTWYDLSGGGNNGTLTNGPTFNSNGAIVFDGVDDTLSTGIPLTNLPALSNFSIECIVKIDSYPTAAPPNQYGSTIKCGVLMGAAYYSGTALYWYGNSSGTACNTYAYIRGADAYRTAGEYNLTPGKYHHLVLVNDYTGGTLKLYANGTLNGSANGPTQEYNPSLTGTAGNIGISKPQVDGGGTAVYSYFQGSVSAAKIYNKALSLEEVKQNYYQAPIVTDGLVLALDAGNLVSYASGSTTTYSLTGSFSGSLTNGVGYSSGNGGSWNFDGADDSINIGTIGGYSNKFSCEAWFKTTSSAAWKNIICGGCGDIIFTINENKVNFGSQCSSPIPHSNYSNTIVNTGEWFFASVTYDSGVAKVYVNGVLENTYTRSNVSQTPGNLRIGSNSTGNSEFFNGTLAVVRMYNKSLTASEVSQNYNAQRSRFGI